MLHKVKDNKDVILNGIIYKPIDGIVDLPEKILNEDLQPIEEADKKKKKHA